MICRVCKKHITDANRYPSRIERMEKLCKPCSDAQSQAWRASHPVQKREISRKYYTTHRGDRVALNLKERVALRKAVLEAYGGRCARCGIDNPIVLDVDHIDNNGASERKLLNRNGVHRGGGGKVYRLLRRKGYPRDNYQLLCRNCNWIKYMESRRSQ